MNSFPPQLKSGGIHRMLDDVGRAQPSARGAYAKVTSHFFAPRPPTSVLGILYVDIANPRTVAVCRRVGGRRSDILAPCLGKREVVSSLLRKEIIISVNQHPGKLTAEFVVRLEVTHEAKDNNKKT